MERAVSTYEGLRAETDRGRLLSRMRALGVRRGPRWRHDAVGNGWSSVTRTERQVAELVRRGLTNPEIAAHLFVSPRTVQTHVPHILTKLGLRSRAHVVGHSMAAGVAQWVARHHPEVVATLVLFNTGPRLSVLGRLAPTAAGHFYAIDPAPIRQLAGALHPWLFSRALLEAHDNLTLPRASLHHPYPQSRAGYEGQLQALLAMDTRPWLAHIGAPTLVVTGEHDLLVPPEEAAVLASGIPAAELVSVPGAGHCAPVERPGPCAAPVLGQVAVAGPGR